MYSRKVKQICFTAIRFEIKFIPVVKISEDSKRKSNRLNNRQSNVFISIPFQGQPYITRYDQDLSRPYNMTGVDITANSIKLIFFFNETNHDSRRHIQKLEVSTDTTNGFIKNVFGIFYSIRFIMKAFRITRMV